MTWPLIVLLIVLFVLVSALVFLMVPTASQYFDVYIIIVIIVIFIILIFTLNFDNPISTTIYLQRKTEPSTLVYNVPSNDDTNFSNLMNVTFTGVYAPDNAPVNATTYENTSTFNYDTFTTASILNGKIVLTKLPNYQIQVAIDPSVGGSSVLDGFLTMNLICTGSQNINGSFSQV